MDIEGKPRGRQRSRRAEQTTSAPLSPLPRPEAMLPQPDRRIVKVSMWVTATSCMTL